MGHAKQQKFILINCLRRGEAASKWKRNGPYHMMIAIAIFMIFYDQFYAEKLSKEEMSDAFFFILHAQWGLLQYCTPMGSSVLGICIAPSLCCASDPAQLFGIVSMVCQRAL